MIRKAKKNDIENIMKAINDAVNLLKDNNVNQWQNGYPNREVFTEDISKGTLWVVEKDDKIAGVCNICIDDDISYEKIYHGSWLTKGSSYMVIHRIAVKKEFYNQGIAKEMFMFAEKEAKKYNISSIRIDTHKFNIPMNQILTKFNYIRCGIIYLVNSRDEDKERVAYEKILI